MTRKSNLGDPGHRWLTAVGAFEGNRSVLNVSITSGGLFDTSTDVSEKNGGTITLSFDSCNSGMAHYDIPSIDRAGSIPIRRVADDNIALCEVLKDE